MTYINLSLEYTCLTINVFEVKVEDVVQDMNSYLVSKML